MKRKTGSNELSLQPSFNSSFTLCGSNVCNAVEDVCHESLALPFGANPFLYGNGAILNIDFVFPYTINCKFLAMISKHFQAFFETSRAIKCFQTITCLADLFSNSACGR